MPTTDDHPDRDAVDTAGFTRILNRPRSMATFVAIVFAVTVVQSLTDPMAALLQGDVVWDYRFPLAAVIAAVVLGCAAQSAFLLLSPRFPVGAVLGTTACYLGLIVGVEVPRWLGALPLVVAVAVFFLAAQRRAVVAAVWTGVVIGAAVGVLSLWSWATGAPLAVTSSFVLSSSLAFAAPVSGAAALGVWWARRMRSLRRARDEFAAAEARHESEIEHARTLERARIAQELHDVAGQHLAGLLSLADAAVDIDGQDAAQATALIGEMRAEGRFASASLYAALRDLRAENGSPVGPTRDLRALDELIEWWRARGMDVSSHTHGEVDDLPAVVSATAYRVVQEALTNACKHAAGAAVSVAVTASERDVRVDVVDAGSERSPAGNRPTGLGWGLSGLAERVDLLHGSFRAGPAETGAGWVVVMEAPLALYDDADAPVRS